MFSVGSWHVSESEPGFVCTSPTLMLLNRGLTIAQLQKPLKISWKQGWNMREGELWCELITGEQWGAIATPKMKCNQVNLAICVSKNVVCWGVGRLYFFLILKSFLFLLNLCLLFFFSASVEYKKCSEVSNGIWRRSPVAFPSQISVISVTCLNNSSLLPFHAFKCTIFSKWTNNHKDWKCFGKECVEGLFLFLCQMLLVG